MAEEKPEESAFIRSVTVGPVPERTCDLCLEELATWYEVGIF